MNPIRYNEQTAEQNANNAANAHRNQNSGARTTTPPPKANNTETKDYVAPSFTPVQEATTTSIAGLDGFSAIQMLLTKMGQMLGAAQEDLATDIKGIVDKVEQVRHAEETLRKRLADGVMSKDDVHAIRAAFVAAGLDPANVNRMGDILDDNNPGNDQIEVKPFSQDELQKTLAGVIDEAKAQTQSMKDSLTSALSLLQARAQRELQNDSEVTTTLSNMFSKHSKTRDAVINNIA